MNKIILIEKYSTSSIFWPNLEKNKKIGNLSVNQILDKYQGFEGELIKSIPFLNSGCEIKIENELMDIEDISTNDNFLMLYLVLDSVKPPSVFNKKILQVGYDVGVCEEEKTIYSSIFNEVLFGNVGKLVAYKDFLNEHFLFETRSLAEKYVDLHDQLSIENEDVEDYEKMHIYEVWKYR